MRLRHRIAQSNCPLRALVPSVWPMASSSALASCMVTPGRNLAPSISHGSRVVSQLFPESGRATAAMEVGTHTSVDTTLIPRNRSFAMPTTVNGWPLSGSVRPMSAGSALNRCVQKRWLSTTSGLAPGRSLSACPNNRPAAGVTPSASK